MRLIDADALPIVTECCVDEAGFFAKFNVVHEEDIRNAPTIEAEPVRHGRWNVVEMDKVKGTVLVECSECGAAFDLPLYAYGLNYHGCPNCLARMDGE